MTAGLYYYGRHTLPGSYISAVYQFVGFPNNVAPGNYTGSQLETNYRSRQVAGYGQATYHVTPTIDLTGGVRYSQDNKSVFDGTLEPGTTYNYDKGRLTWLANISYKPTEAMMLYGKFTTGYVAGGVSAFQGVVQDRATPSDPYQNVVVSAAVPYKEETAVSWETGIKADFFDRRLRTNFALFYVTYNNLQQVFPTTTTAIGPLSHQPVTFQSFATTNIGKSRDYGLEYEIYAMPIKGLTLSATGAYNNFKYIEAIPGQVEPVYRPKFTANLAAEYSVPLSGDMRVSFRGDAEYRSHIALGNHRIVTAYPENDRLNELLFQDALMKLNARVTLSNIPLGPTTSRVSVWGRNLTNKQRFNSGGDFGTVISGVFDDPVTYGVDLAVEF